MPFGYPDWKELGSDVLDYTLKKLPQKGPLAGYIQSLKQEADRLGAKAKADALMFMIGACKEALRQVPQGLEGYYRLFSNNFKKALYPESTSVFEAIFNLPVRRFITTNYDMEIERALIQKSMAAPKDFAVYVKNDSEEYRHRRSLTQRSEDLGLLTLFSLTRAPGNDYMVFHCHGRHDQPKSIVATESDYQQWYLSPDDNTSVAFQQSIQLLLGSNPLLFIGYSLRDEDLLRPLRQLGVVDPAQKNTRPIFALLACSKEHPEADRLHREVLSERFGLHVIPYPLGVHEDQTLMLSKALEQLKRDLETAHSSWSEKPFLRQPEKMPELPNPYCEIKTSIDLPVKQLKGLEEEVRRPGVVVLVGPSGSGKTLHALKLTVTERDHFSGIFYWNAHYGNEAMTAIDHALAYFDPSNNIKGTRHERINKCLQKNRFLLILDGCERLLRVNKDDPREGVTYSVTFHRLLRAFADPNNESTVVLASRLKPLDLDLLQSDKNGLKIVRYLSASRVEVEDLKKSKPFAAMLASKGEQLQRAHEEISALCSLLRGHNYGLFLSGRYLEMAGYNVAHHLQALKDLNRRLADRHRDERLQEMVHQQVKRVSEILEAEEDLGAKSAGKKRRRAEPAHDLLNALTNFLGPVSKEAIEICFKEACIMSYQKCSCVREKLEAAGLLFPMRLPVVAAGFSETYTIHCTARTALLRSQHSAPTDPLPAFGLSGSTCGRLGVNPDRARKLQLRKLFDRIIEAAESRLEKGEKRTKSKKKQEEDCRHARALCRDAFSLVRTGMDANTAPRWCTYDEYVQFPLAVAILAKRVASGCWTYCEHADTFELAEREDASLYPAELAWLYHDIALALSGSGSIHDACTFLEQAYEVTRLIEHPSEGGGFHLEVLLSLAYTFVEMGRLAAAGRHLDDAERLLRELPDDDFEARILGLRGLMLHLQGDLQGADDLYDRCLKLLRPGVNLRAQSIFLKHKADVKISMQKFEEADLLVRNSRALAEAGVFPELVANARISEGHRLTRTGQAVKARLEYTAVLREAQRIGFRKLEVRALTALARLALDQKDAEGGRDFAIRALSLANQFGQGLRQSHALVVLGLATLELGQTDLGIAYLRNAKRLADDQQYWSRSREAENKLLELGVSPERED